MRYYVFASPEQDDPPYRGAECITISTNDYELAEIDAKLACKWAEWVHIYDHETGEITWIKGGPA